MFTFVSKLKIRDGRLSEILISKYWPKSMSYGNVLVLINLNGI